MNDKQMYSECLECGGKFRVGGLPATSVDKIPGIELEKESLTCGIERHFYRCPHCGFEYTVMLTDEEIRALMEKREKLRGFEKIKNQGVRQQKIQEFETLDREIKKKLNKLNGK